MYSPYEKLSIALVADLHPRIQDVLMRRFGLRGEEPETLEAIGQTHGVTRERVRQIVEDGMRQLREDARRKNENEKFYKVLEEILVRLSELGHIKREDFLLREWGIPHAANHIVFILHLGEKFHKYKETDYAHSFWTSKKDLGEMSAHLLEALREHLQKKGEVADFQELAKAYPSYEGIRLHPATLLSFLEISKLIARTYNGKWGLREWRQVDPKGVRDKAYLALREAGSPLHFVEVAKHIERLQEAMEEQRQKAVLSQTVHNELIKDDRFVLVGRGTYALREWGYKPGTVKDVMVEILREHGKPMTKEEIVQKTLSQRRVKEGTILLNLQDKKCFLREDGGYRCIGE